MTGKAKRPGTRLVSGDVDLTKAGELIRAAGYCVGKGDPIVARGWWDGQRKLRRLKASFVDGWKVTIGLRADGGWSMSWGIKLVSRKDAA
jgi:hypothetical protein